MSQAHTDKSDKSDKSEKHSAPHTEKAAVDFDPVISHLESVEDPNIGKFKYTFRISDPANAEHNYPAELQSKTKLDFGDKAVRQGLWKRFGVKGK